jgi:hypothetical protein
LYCYSAEYFLFVRKVKSGGGGGGESGGGGVEAAASVEARREQEQEQEQKRDEKDVEEETETTTTAETTSADGKYVTYSFDEDDEDDGDDGSGSSEDDADDGSGSSQDDGSGSSSSSSSSASLDTALAGLGMRGPSPECSKKDAAAADSAGGGGKCVGVWLPLGDVVVRAGGDMDVAVAERRGVLTGFAKRKHLKMLPVAADETLQFGLRVQRAPPRGGAVQVELSCPQLESDWFQPLNLSSEKLVSSLISFKFNVYRYTEGPTPRRCSRWPRRRPT